MSCRLNSLRIDRAPGFPAGGPALEALEAGLNLVTGPNGSGKSTLARAALTVLTGQAAAARLEISAEVTTPAGLLHLLWRGDRLMADPPAAGDDRFAAPAEAIEPSWLYLHLPDLLVADESGFMQQVAQELAGGIDVGRLRRSIEEPPSAPNAGPLAELRRRQADFERARQAQASGELLDRLRRLEEEVASAEAAARRQAQLHAAVGVAELRARLADAVAAREAAPAAHGLLPADADRLPILRQSLQSARQRRLAIERDRQSPAGLRPNAPAATDEALTAAKALLDSWREALRAEGTANSNAQRAQAAVEGAHADWQHVGGPASIPEVTDQIDLGSVEQLVRRQLELAARRSTIEALERLHSAEEPGVEPGPTADQLRRARDILEDWVNAPWVTSEAPAAPTFTSGAPWLFAAGLLVAGVGLAVAHGLSDWGTGIAVIGLGMAAVAGWKLRTPPASMPAVATRPGRDDARQRYRERGLPEPAEWTDPAVRAWRDQLDQQARTAAEREQRAAEREQRQPEVDRLREDEARLAADFAELRARLGAPTDLAASGLIEWHRARQRTLTAMAAAKSATLEAEQATQEQAAARARLAAALDRIGLSAPDSPDTTSANIEALRRWSGSGRELERARAEEVEATQAIAALVGRAALPADTHPESSELDEALSRARRYWTADQEVQDAQRLLDQAVRRCPEEARPLAERPLEELAAELEGERTAAAEGTAARNKLFDARLEASRFADGDAIATALVNLEQAQVEVLALRDRWAGARIAHQALGWIEQKLQSEHQPERVLRAGALLRQFTQGHHELEPLSQSGASGRPVLRVRNSVTGASVGLDALSSGTRVQLLLALRLAQGGEPAGAFPLILDETLAQADPMRATAVMEAVVGLTGPDGGPRQLLVFTAQPEEAARWAEAAARTGAPVFRHCLGPSAAAADTPVPTPPAGLPPEPETGESADAYASRLATAGFAPTVDPLAPADAAGWAWWDLPVGLTHNLARFRLITHGSWRAAPSIIRDRVVPDPVIRRQLDLLAQAWDVAAATWREGRASRRATPDDLEDIPQIGPEAKQRLEDWLRNNAWNPLALITHLETDGIQGIRTGRIDSIKSTWRERGILLTDAPATDIHQRVIEALLAADPTLTPAEAISATRAALRWLPS